MKEGSTGAVNFQHHRGVLRPLWNEIFDLGIEGVAGQIGDVGEGGPADILLVESLLRMGEFSSTT